MSGKLTMGYFYQGEEYKHVCTKFRTSVFVNEGSRDTTALIVDKDTLGVVAMICSEGGPEGCSDLRIVNDE